MVGFLTETLGKVINPDINCKEVLDLETDHLPMFKFWIGDFGRSFSSIQADSHCLLACFPIEMFF